jgi:poly(3-hydroxybutyrate) depolymerase
MKRLILPALLLFGMTAGAQTYETKFTRPLSDVLGDVSKRFGVKLKYNVDTTGLKLAYADFRVRPYSLEETLNNILAPFDFKAVKQNDKLYKIKPYEYPRRQAEDGMKLVPYLSSLYADKAAWEARKDTLRKEVRARLGIDKLLAVCSKDAPEYGKIRKFDGYTVQNFRLKTANGHTVCGSIYAPKGKGKHPLIICPNGHFSNGRYGTVQQQRLATLARMGAICVDYDLWGWGESADEVGSKAHQTPEAHVMQALNGIRILDWMIQRKDVDKTRVGVNGGSGGGTQSVLLSVLDDRYTACCPVVSVSSWFDGGCPCESGMPIQLAGGGTCNAELAAMFAPKPMMLVSDGGDWTSTTPELEYPYIKRIYGFYGAADKVMNVHLPKERHDFGPNKRNAVYKFFIETFKLDASKLDEDKVVIEEENALRFTPKAK